MPKVVSCATDTTHASYDRECVASLFQTWTRVAAVFDRFRGGFCGRQTQVDLWWGTFDLSVARYSGRAASPPFDRGAIEREAMTAEESLVGFWPGDEQSPEPAFFSYTYPKPAGIESAAVSPAGALWSPEAGEFIVPYEVIRRAPDPSQALLEFCESTYAAGARLGRLGPRVARAPAVRGARRLTRETEPSAGDQVGVLGMARDVGGDERARGTTRSPRRRASSSANPARRGARPRPSKRGCTSACGIVMAPSLNVYVARPASRPSTRSS